MVCASIGSSGRKACLFGFICVQEGRAPVMGLSILRGMQHVRGDILFFKI